MASRHEYHKLNCIITFHWAHSAFNLIVLQTKNLECSFHNLACERAIEGGLALIENWLSHDMTAIELLCYIKWSFDHMEQSGSLSRSLYKVHQWVCLRSRLKARLKFPFETKIRRPKNKQTSPSRFKCLPKLAPLLFKYRRLVIS